MQLITTIETGPSGNPVEAVQGLEFANAEEARLLVQQLGSYACQEGLKSRKGETVETVRVRELAARITQQVETKAIADAPVSFLLRNPDLRPGGFRSSSERLILGGILRKLAWHHGIPVVSPRDT